MHDAEELASGLLTGQYDIGAFISSRRYNAKGTFWDPEVNNEVVSLFEDVIKVNFQPWPYFAVEPRKYRFRSSEVLVGRSRHT
jgi:bilirubin oxidase